MFNSDTIVDVFSVYVKTIVRKEQYKGDTVDKIVQKNSIVNFYQILFLS